MRHTERRRNDHYPDMLIHEFARSTPLNQTTTVWSLEENDETIAKRDAGEVLKNGVRFILLTQRHYPKAGDYERVIVMSFDPVKIVVASELKQFEFNGIEITGFICKIIKKENRGETVRINMNFSIMMNCPTDRDRWQRTLPERPS
ncbi:hypothetical protein TNCV_2663191 [Trichonephila clavipes]|nr:hypothetical protein TNCV_2663191 [Trichonephila clavipes]